MMRILLTIFFLLYLGMAVAQTSGNETKNHLDDLEFLVGEWKGEGWILSPNGKIPLVSTEIVQSKLNNQAILVEGIHRSRNSSGEAGNIIFQALALITYNNETSKFDWRSATDRGRGGNFIAYMAGKDTLHWGLENSFRYIITVDEQGRWYEIGENTRDGGKTWTQFFEMTLEKQ